MEDNITKTVKQIGHGFFKFLERLFFSFYKSLLMIGIFIVSVVYIGNIDNFFKGLGMSEFIWIIVSIVIIIIQFIIIALGLRNLVIGFIRFINPNYTNEYIKENNQIV